MRMPPATETENKPSSLLSLEENNQVFRLIGNRCQTIATAVIELFITDPPNHSQWNRKDTGVLCFVKDNIKKNYFFRLFCLRRNIMIWEHELYNNMEYDASTNFLHIFEAQEYLVAYNFASTDEARDMKRYVINKIHLKRIKEEKRKHSRENNNTPSFKSTNNYQDMPRRKVVDQTIKVTKRRRNITKADIGAPQDFKHVSHVGWNPDSGFDVNVEDQQLRKFFMKAGVSEKQLQDKETRDFIYDFIDKNGGREALVDSTDSNNFSVPPPLFPATPAPPVPPRGPNKPHVRAAPPPPPSTNHLPQLHQSHRPRINHDKVNAPQPSSIDLNFAAPPPPPPLPVDLPPSYESENAQTFGLGPTPPPVAFDMSSSALMQSIREGTTLKPVEERKGGAVSSTGEARNDLLSEIRKGFCLKPVQEREVKPIDSQGGEKDASDLAGALARALAERSKAIHSEDSDENEDSNEEEWDD